MSPISNIFPSVNLSNAQDSGLAAIAAGSQKLNQDAQQMLLGTLLDSFA
jgi:hypothetical protein